MVGLIFVLLVFVIALIMLVSKNKQIRKIGCGLIFLPVLIVLFKVIIPTLLEDYVTIIITGIIILLIFLFGLILLIANYKNKQRRRIAYLVIFFPVLIFLYNIGPLWWENYKGRLHKEKAIELTKNGVIFTFRLSSWPADEVNYCSKTAKYLYKDSTKICLLLDSSLYIQGEYILSEGYKTLYLNNIGNAKLKAYSVEDLKRENKEVWVTLRANIAIDPCIELLELIKIEKREVSASNTGSKLYAIKKLDTISKKE